jgi:hypothetical protein
LRLEAWRFAAEITRSQKNQPGSKTLPKHIGKQWDAVAGGDLIKRKTEAPGNAGEK